MSGWFVSPETFVIQFIILCLIIWVLKKFVFIPYLAYLDAWEDKQQKLEEEYRNIDWLVVQAKNDKEKELLEARKKSEKMISEAELIAKNKKKTILEKAEAEATDIISSWRTTIENEKNSMLNDVKSNIVDLVVKFNTKMFKKENISREFVEKEIELMK